MTFPQRIELSEQALAVLIDEHPDVAHVAMELDGTIRDWGAAATARFGWTRDQALGRRMVELTDGRGGAGGRAGRRLSALTFHAPGSSHFHTRR